jgi:O-antigen/teichoic acid export membrane protein
MNLVKTIRQRKGITESLSNIGWRSGGTIVRLLGGAVVGIVVARYLGPRQFGLLNFALAIYSLFNIVSNLGMDSLVVRDVVLDQSNEHEVLGTAFVLKAAASVVTAITATFVEWLMEPHNGILIAIVALMSFASISQALDVVDYFFQAKVRSRYTVVPRTIVFVAASVARLVAVYLHMSLLAFAWIAALEVLFSEIGLGFSYLCYRRTLPRWNWHLPRAKSLLSESWPLLISSIMIVLYMRTDQLLLGKLSTMSTVGVYSVAVRLSEIWYAIPIIVTGTVMPRLLQTRDLDSAKYQSRLLIFYESMILASLFVVAGTLLAGPFVIKLLYGQQFAPASKILSIHIWTGVFVAVGCIGGQQYVHEKITISSVQRTALGAVVNVVLNFLWIPHWGGMGSAMATLVAQSIGSYFGDAFDYRTRHIFRMKTRAYLQFWRLPFQVWQEVRR